MAHLSGCRLTTSPLHRAVAAGARGRPALRLRLGGPRPPCASVAPGPASEQGRPAARRPPLEGNNALPKPDAGTAKGANSGFNWLQQWYPLAPVSYLDKTKPAAYTVLGRRLVVWFHAGARSWQALEDRCPHRLAPLSEGCIDQATGNLLCSYHGWQFGAGGRCARIPQADSPVQEATVRSSSRSCVAAFPVREEQGLLWVWMDSSPASAAASQQRRVALPDELQSSGASDPAGMLLGDWYMRELPVSAEFLLENLLDPAHVHFAHHGIIGSRDRSGSIRLDQEGPLTAQGGFRLRMQQQTAGRGVQRQRPQRVADEALDTFPWDVPYREEEANPPAGSASAASGKPSVTHFIPPALVWLEVPFGDRHVSMLFFAVPVSPRTCRIIAGYSVNDLPPAIRSMLQSGVMAPVAHTFQFIGDLAANEVIDGDTIHIYQQEQVVRREGLSWRQAYFMPAQADRGVLLLRRWMDEKAGGGPDYSPTGASSTAPGQAQAPALRSSRVLRRREILDRYEQHTLHCPSCRRALSTVRAARQVLQTAGASGYTAAFLLAASQALALRGALVGPGRASLPVLLGMAALAAGVLEQQLGRLEQQFVFVDYAHADK